MSEATPIDCDRLREWAGRVCLVEACDTVGRGILRMSTPFKYPNGGNVDLFIRQSAPLHNGWSLTDMGQTADYLFDMGMRLNTHKRKLLAEDVCRALEVRRNGGVLEIELTAEEMADNLSSAMVRLAQACIRTADIAFTQQLRGQTTFKNELEEFLVDRDVRVETNVILDGIHGKEVLIDFRTHGQRITSLVQTLATAGGGATHQMSNELFRKWHDLGPQRAAHECLTVYDSQGGAHRDDDLARLGDYSTVLAFPAQQEQILEAVAA